MNENVSGSGKRDLRAKIIETNVRKGSADNVYWRHTEPSERAPQRLYFLNKCLVLKLQTNSLHL